MKRILVAVVLTLVGMFVFSLPVLAEGDDVCGSLPNSMSFTHYFGEVTIDGHLAPIGTVVQAVDPRGLVVGCFETWSPGHYGAMRVYGTDFGSIPGLYPGEEVRFLVNGEEVNLPSPIIFHDDWDLHQVDLSESIPTPESTATAAPTLEPTTQPTTIPEPEPTATPMPELLFPEIDVQVDPEYAEQPCNNNSSIVNVEIKVVGDYPVTEVVVVEWLEESGTDFTKSCPVLAMSGGRYLVPTMGHGCCLSRHW